MRDDDDSPVFRPKFGKRTRAGQPSASPRFRNAVLALTRAGARLAGRARSKGHARGRIAVRPAASSSRRVIVKVHVAPLRGGGQRAAALHLRYIQRDGVEKDGTPGVLYGQVGASQPDTTPPLPNERHQFRMIVSPEEAGELDLSVFVRRFMSQIERDLGRRLEWSAVNHYNTEHPHAHIVVRGVDREGREVRLPRTYIARGLRDRARQLATEELGPRPAVDFTQQRRREVTLDRFTQLDRTLERRATANRIDLDPANARDRARQAESFLMGRLHHLQTLQLADRVATRSWVLTEGWGEHLRQLGARGDIIKQMHLALRADPSRYEIVRASDAAQRTASPSPIVGRVVSKGLSDELRGSYYVVVEKPDGGGAYVPIAASAAEQIRAGDLVQIATISWKWRRREDAEIHQQARANSGVYDAPRTSEPPRIATEYRNISFPIDQNHSRTYLQSPMVQGTTNNHAKRLAALEKLGLAVPVSDVAGRWRIDEALLAKLDAKDAAEPRTRLVVERQRRSIEEQVKQLAPVWLDDLAPEGLATFGLGAELRAAMTERAAHLRHHGIDLADPASRQRLRDAERDALVGRIIHEHGGQPLRPSGAAFRGTVVRLHEAPGGGAPYAEVRRGARFVLIAATPDVRAKLTVGRAVRVAITAEGNFDVRLPQRNRERGALS